MKKFLVVTLLMSISVLSVNFIYSDSCLNHWDKYVSITRCDGSHPISCGAPYLAGLHKCCESGTTYENCPPGDWYPTFVAYINGNCKTVPCEGISGKWCVGGTEITDQEPDDPNYLAPKPNVWAPNDRGLGVCWLPL